MKNIKKERVIFIFLVILIFSIFMILGCGGKITPLSNSITFRVIQFKSSALHFDYDDGSGEWFDASQVKLLNPKQNGSIFWIYHEMSPSEDSPWRKEGAVINCKYSEEIFEALTESTQFFSGALEAIDE